ncbi:hypothetical protein M8C21_009227 [Ambrosia artemisiifolia]|uniref:Uncharacterized protein n=1 Tax=Ambrosia artemisiifolia TaxID=4212 RepID=A0AAD5D4Q9_AMBAR|nr:hypothetical protein M8C21_009227 [Ambrosia artemisiifolia]
MRFTKICRANLQWPLIKDHLDLKEYQTINDVTIRFNHTSASNHPFSIVAPWLCKQAVSYSEDEHESYTQTLTPGMVLLKRFISRLDLHQDCHEDGDCIKKGKPVILQVES